MAYCLLGIFEVNMPLLYGEGTKAFDRLQEEILKRSYDHSLLAWGLLPWDQSYSRSATEPCGILATSIVDFAGCGNLNVCPRFANHNLSEDYQMTNEGLRVSLSLRAPRSNGERHRRLFVAILNCFSRQEPSRRIGILLQEARSGVFIRTGRSLLLSDIHPIAPATGYEYVSKTIRIAIAKDVARLQPSGSDLVPALVDFPSHYRYNVEYVHPWYKVEKDNYVAGPHALRLKSQQLEEVIQSGAEIPRLPGANGFVEHCRALWCDILTNIIRGRRPFSQVRAQPDSIILCVKLIRENYVKLTRENHALHRHETPSFLVFLATFSDFSGFKRCYLAPLPQNSSHMQSAHPSSMFHGLMGLRSLTVANETFIVRHFSVPDNLNEPRTAELFKIEAKIDDYLVLKVPLRQHLWIFVYIIGQFVVRCKYILGSLAAYALVLFFLSIIVWPDDTHTLYLTIWTLCFMPLIYEIRMDPFKSYQALSKYEGIFIRMIIVFIGFAASLYPALQPILQWPTTCTSYSNGTAAC